MKRREVLKSAGIVTAAALTGPFFHIRPARADKGELVVVSWGGDYDTALREHVVAALEKTTGYTVKLDAPPETAKVKAMVQSGNVSWDVIMTDAPAVQAMLKDNLLEPIEYAAVDKARLAKIPKELQQQYALGQRIYSFNIVYNSKLMPKAKHTRNWTEVWDAKNFPGGRTFNFQGGTAPQLEAALLADGVPMDKLYPLDIERAWKMMDKLRPRGIAAKKQGAPIDVDYNQGKLASDNWCLVKGVRDKKIAMEFINIALDPKLQALIAQKVPYGPSNSGAFEFLSAAEAADLATSPENIKNQFWWNTDWWSTPGPDGKTPRESQGERFAKWMVMN